MPVNGAGRRDRRARDSTALVGTPEAVAKALLEYHNLNATTLLIRGYDLGPDAVQYGEELIPRVRELVAENDAAEAGYSSFRGGKASAGSSPSSENPML